MFDWLYLHHDLIKILGIVSIVMFIGSLILLPVLISFLPQDYFAKETPLESKWSGKYRLFRLPLRILKNLLGVVFVLAGIAMLVLPGQGLLTVLLGLITMDLPGKRKLILWLVRKPKVFNAINWIRRKSNHPEMDAVEEA